MSQQGPFTAPQSGRCDTTPDLSGNGVRLRPHGVDEPFTAVPANLETQS